MESNHTDIISQIKDWSASDKERCAAKVIYWVKHQDRQISVLNSLEMLKTTALCNMVYKSTTSIFYRHNNIHTKQMVCCEND